MNFQVLSKTFNNFQPCQLWSSRLCDNFQKYLKFLVNQILQLVCFKKMLYRNSIIRNFIISSSGIKEVLAQYFLENVNDDYTNNNMQIIICLNSIPQMLIVHVYITNTDSNISHRKLSRDPCIHSMLVTRTCSKIILPQILILVKISCTVKNYKNI